MPAFQQTVEPRLYEPLDRLLGGFLEYLTADGFGYVFVDKVERGLRSVFHA